MMASPQIVLTGDKEADIHNVVRYIERHIAENWEVILQSKHDKLLDAYNRAGDMAYGTYLNLLFRPVHRHLKQVGLRLAPKLPGDFEISREWGNKEETDQQRWMWSSIESAEGETLGTIVTITYHDHSQFRVPRQPGVLGLTETGKEAVVEALSSCSADFKEAREASIEIAEYLQSLESKG